MRAPMVLSLLLVAGCLRSTVYKCNSDSQCAPGQCATEGFCSFADPECASGQRFGTSAGGLSNTCVPGGVTELDSGTDTGSSIDVMPDMPPANCPTDFAAITGGTSGHVYKLVTQTRDWNAQRMECASMGTAYLAFMSDAGELAALVAENGGNKIWLGITDAATEQTWLDVEGGTQTFLPWKSGSPTVNPQNNDDDCVVADSATEIIDDQCNQAFAALCECDE